MAGRRRVPSHSVLRLVLVPMLGSALPASAATLYTPDADVAFDGAPHGVNVRGVIEAVSGQEMAAIETDQAVVVPLGEPVPTEPVASVACFSTIDFPPCGVPGGDLLVYRVRLDPESGALVEAAARLTPSPPPVLGGGFVIDDDPASVEPTGEIFILGGRGVVFQNFTDPGDPTVQLNPGETSAILVTGWQAGDLGGALDAGKELGIWIGDAGFSRHIFPVSVPEPGAALGSAAALGVLGALARRSARGGATHRRVSLFAPDRGDRGDLSRPRLRS